MEVNMDESNYEMVIDLLADLIIDYLKTDSKEDLKDIEPERYVA